MVNATAYTAVDRAETEADAAMRVNRDGPAALAAWCAEAGIPLIHVSTDYVFDGLKGAPYVETDPTNPTGVYGATKLAGEQAVLAGCPRSIILRTSWVYAASGRNFVLTMLNARARTDRLRVVADQIGCPTTAADLARVILQIAARIRAEGWDDRYAGLYHAAGRAGPVGTAWPRRCSRKRRGMAWRRRWSSRSPPRTGRPRYAGRRTRGWTAPAWLTPSAFICHPGGKVLQK